MKRTLTASLSIAALLLTATAQSATLIDCPLRDQPYSMDTPLIDVLLKPEARAAMDQIVPGMLDRMPEHMARAEAPSFAAIITPRTFASMAQLPAEALSALDDALSALEVTDDDREARCARYDVEVPELTVSKGTPRVLVFEKINGFHHGDAVTAATEAVQAMAERNGWGFATTDQGGAMTPEILDTFDVVVWNNVSGDVLTLTQRQAFETYIESGGGFVGIHGSAGDSVYFWDWYVDELLGAHFQGHPNDPQFQDARIDVEDREHIGHGLPEYWTLNEEWYSFHNNPRDGGAHVVATVDESTYVPEGYGGQNLRMGDDHPIAWTHCVGEGRSFYSALGHLAENYQEPNHVRLLEQGIAWAAGQGDGQGKAPCGQP